MNKGFFGSLFDFSFSEFVTPKIISVLYIIGMVFAGIGALFMIVAGFTNGFGSGLVALLLSPVVFLLYVIMIRVYLELVVVLFKIYGGIRIMSEGQGGQFAAQPPQQQYRPQPQQPPQPQRPPQPQQPPQPPQPPKPPQ